MKRHTSKLTTRRIVKAAGKRAVNSIMKRTGLRAITALERGKNLAFTVRAKAVAGAKSADKAVKAHPYRALGIAAGVGAVVGLALSRRRVANKTGEKEVESAD